MASRTDARLLKTTKFPPEFNKKVDMQKVNLGVMKKWIASRISEILGNDDDVVIELCFNLVDGPRHPDIKALQIQLTGFLDKDTAPFCKELWKLFLSAQESPQGVPKELLEAKKLELMQEKLEQGKAAETVRKRREDLDRREQRNMPSPRDARDRPRDNRQADLPEDHLRQIGAIEETEARIMVTATSRATETEQNKCEDEIVVVSAPLPPRRLQGPIPRPVLPTDDAILQDAQPSHGSGLDLYPDPARHEETEAGMRDAESEADPLLPRGDDDAIQEARLAIETDLHPCQPRLVVPEVICPRRAEAEVQAEAEAEAEVETETEIRVGAGAKAGVGVGVGAGAAVKVSVQREKAKLRICLAMEQADAGPQIGLKMAKATVHHLRYRQAVVKLHNTQQRRPNHKGALTM